MTANLDDYCNWEAKDVLEGLGSSGGCLTTAVATNRLGRVVRTCCKTKGRLHTLQKRRTMQKFNPNEFPSSTK